MEQEQVAHVRKDVVASQSVNVIEALLAFDSAQGRCNGNFKLTIPYFGTISIVRPQQMTPQSSNTNTPSYVTTTTQPQQHQPISIDQQLPSGSWPGLTFTPSSTLQNPATVPIGSFNTGGNFAPMGQEVGNGIDWGLPEADTMFFDSLLSTDIEGNWIF